MNNEIILENECDYIKNMRAILNNYHGIYKLKGKGNTTAIAIITDINNAIQQLNDRQKHCIIKHFIEGYEIQEIAQDLDITSCTVEIHIRKAIKNMSVILEGKDVVEAWEVAVKLKTN